MKYSGKLFSKHNNKKETTKHELQQKTPKAIQRKQKLIKQKYFLKLKKN